MSKLVRYEFLGSRWVVALLGATVIGIPLAIVYLLESLVVVHEDMERPTAFLEAWRKERGL